MKPTKLKLLLSSPFLLLLLLTFNPVKVFGQGTKITPDCVIFINVTLAAQTTVTIPGAPAAGGAGDNRTEGCQTYTLSYQAVGTGALTSLDFQAGQSSTTTVMFASWAGTVNTGIDPNTSSTGATSTFSTGCVSMSACTVANSWLQILITRGTFVGTVNGVLYGFKTGNSGPSPPAPSSPCPGTAATPCVVDGPTATGMAPTTPPVLVAGQDGAPGVIRTIKTDAAGQPIPANASFAGADGISNTETSPAGAAGVQLYTRILPYLFGGTTNDRQFACLFQAVAVVAPGTTGVLITGTMGKTTKICHYHMSTDQNANVTITSGTGSVCGTGTATIDGYIDVSNFAMDFSPLAPLKSNAAGDDICYTFSPGAVTATIEAIYAQF